MFFRKEKKNYNNWSFLNILRGDYVQVNNPTEFIDFYVQACPVFTATKLIADAVSSIDIVLKDKNGDYIYEHEALKILRNPNPFTDGQLFIKELASYYILTGNTYLNIIGEKKPVELNCYNPASITIQSASDGYAGDYTYSSSSLNFIYYRAADKRFLDDRKNELAHLRDFNPNFSSTNLVGSSSFLGCQLEISQYILASIHNNSLLKNQARPSGIITYKGSNDLQQSQIDGLKDVLKNKLSGAKNAGEPAFLGGDFNWLQLSESVKDMDFPTLKKSVAEAIYSAAKIPLPMISPDNMSFANMDASKFAFYDNAVLPTLKRILKFLTAKVLVRYNLQGLEYSFDESAIEALEARKYDTADKAAKIGVLSDNELRAMIGYEATNGGDGIYKPANLVQVGLDTYTADNRDQPVGKSEFVKLMTEQKKLNGERLYSDEYIQLKAKQYYDGNRH
jgi:HK97 family phage portal protein